MSTTAEQLKKAFAEKMAQAKSLSEFNELRVEFLGKKGVLTEALKGLKNLPEEERKETGKQLNLLRAEMENAISEKITACEEAARAEALSKIVPVDLTMPAAEKLGSLHPVTIIQREIEDIFRSMGFIIEDGNEVETEYNNFEAVNIPKHHPARDMQDTYYLDNGQLLKTHTSAAQNRILRKYGAPCKVLFPGRCFRNEALDASHENTFLQMEGMMVGEDVSISNLVYFMKLLLTEVFKREVKVRLRPGFFPFVEPGFELDISCLICGGEGCPTCKNSGWVELLPCGMIHPNVLTMGGVDPEKYTGFAFGLGLTRLVMMRYGIKDIRTLNSGNLKALSQFGTK